jgi:ferredoxin-NADP reductase
MSMLRHRAAVGSTVPAALLFSSRSAEDIIFRDELDRLATAGDDLRVVHTLTRRQPAGWTAPARRVDRAMLAELGIPPAERPWIYVCGPTSMVEQATQALLSLGHAPDRIRAERFGATGDEH